MIELRTSELCGRRGDFDVGVGKNLDPFRKCVLLYPHGVAPRPNANLESHWRWGTSVDRDEATGENGNDVQLCATAWLALTDPRVEDCASGEQTGDLRVKGIRALHAQHARVRRAPRERAAMELHAG